MNKGKAPRTAVTCQRYALTRALLRVECGIIWALQITSGHEMRLRCRAQEERACLTGDPAGQQATAMTDMQVDLHLYAGQVHFFGLEAQFCDAIADAMAFFIARFAPVQQPVTTA